MSSPSDNKGEIDGRPVTWFYQRPENDQEGRLSWAEGTVTCKWPLGLEMTRCLMMISTKYPVDTYQVGPHNRRLPFDIEASTRTPHPLCSRE